MTNWRARRPVLFGLAGVALAGAAWPAAASPLLYERTFLLAAGARCHLFERGVAAALSAGQAQARREAVRAGAGAAELDGLEARARRAAAAKPCSAADLRQQAARIRQAHAGYARVERMTYPGQVASWRADRGSSARVRWRLAQTAEYERRPMTFGLAGGDAGDALTAVVEFPNGRTPYAARLVMRDARRSARPFLDDRGLRPGAVLPLARRLPTGGGLVSYAAAWRGPAPAPLAASGARRPTAFRFPAEAATALAGLDPREAVAVEFLFTDGARRVYLEVGDFAAGYDFLKLATR